MILKSLRRYFNNSLLGYYDENEINSFFRILAEDILRLKPVDITLSLYQVVSGKKYDKFQLAIEGLKEYQPVQYILGKTQFYDLTLKVDKSVLIPRLETEELVDWIIKDFRNRNPLSILDIGTGSGCIATALVKNLPISKVHAVDVSKEALSLAKTNAKLNDVKVEFGEMDILDTEKWSYEFGNMQFDVIVSNPPYVKQSEKSSMRENVLNYEPHLALFVEDEDALIFYRTIIEFSKKYLKPHGTLYFEINEGLGEATFDLMHSLFKDVELKKDINGKDRMLKGTKL